MRPRHLIRLAALGAALAVPSSAAAAAPCPPAPYPGDAAPAEAIADWMARGALNRSIPGELPVMAALVESDLRNLSSGDADSVGYFQMRLQYWDMGAYRGYATNPDLQLQWFNDQATDVETRRIAAAKPARAPDETQWGEWIADVERPASQYRSRYQLRLAEARALIGDPCDGAGTIPVADVTRPDTRKVIGPKARTTARTLRFRFAASEPATFQCRRDGARYRPCSSPLVLTRLPRGRHTVRVRAIDTAGNVDATPAVFSFQIV